MVYALKGEKGWIKKNTALNSKKQKISIHCFMMPQVKALKQLPNLLTLCNLFCGCVGISSSIVEVQVLMILLGMCFDFADGMTARLLKAYSEIGKQLDSLADMVTFGVLPSKMLFDMIEGKTSHAFIAYLVMFYALGAAWRLARFNSFDAHKPYFVGLPSPAAAFVVASVVYSGKNFFYFGEVVSGLFFALFLSLLMVANLPLLSLKFKNLSWQENMPRYVLILISLILGLLWQLAAVPLIIFIYVCLSILFREKIINQ